MATLALVGFIPKEVLGQARIDELRRMMVQTLYFECVCFLSDEYLQAANSTSSGTSQPFA